MIADVATGYDEHLKKAYRAFFSPPKYESKASQEAVIQRGRNYRLPFDEGELAVTAWGQDGPAVLLMHGWGGARAQMTGFVDPLLSAGYRPVAYDQPAQGESDGRLTNLLEIAPTMDLIATREGPFEAIIAHSFGTLVTSYALVERNFPAPRRLIYLGAINRLLDSLPRFQVIANLPDEMVDGLRRMIHANFEKYTLEAIANEDLTPKINVPALMFHDTTDNVTPIEDSRAIAKVWKRAQFHETTGLGHRGALSSNQVHEQIVTFLQSP